MQCDFVFAYLRLSRDDKEKMEESNSIKNQRLLIQHFVENQPPGKGYHRNTKLYRKNISVPWGAFHFNQ